MKKIYTFSVEGDDPYSGLFRSNLRLLAYMLYESIYLFNDEYTNPLNISKNIVYNHIHEDDRDMGYYFDSDIHNMKMIDYEPFIIGNNVFGFTVNDELISEEEIKELVNYVLRLTKLSYIIDIHSFGYISSNSEDESHRERAFKEIFNYFHCKSTRKSSLVRSLSKFTKKNVAIY